jgi:hypothetical protein
MAPFSSFMDKYHVDPMTTPQLLHLANELVAFHATQCWTTLLNAPAGHRQGECLEIASPLIVLQSLTGNWNEAHQYEQRRIIVSIPPRV